MLSPLGSCSLPPSFAVTAERSSAGSGPHLLEATLAGARGAAPRRQLTARREALLEIGWRHTGLTVGESGSRPPLRAPWFRAARWWLDRNSVARLISEAQPDIIETSDPFVLGGAVLEAADDRGVPAVAWCHGDPLLGLGRPRDASAAHASSGALNAWADRRALGLLQRVYDRYDLVLAPSRSMTAQLQAHGVAHAAYQPLGVDCSVFTPNACDHAWRRQLEASLHIAPGTRLLVYVGRFGAAMRLDLLVRAVQALGPGHVLLAIGNGPCPPSGEQVICMPPALNDAHLARLLASCDAFVHAGGDAEHSGAALLDAMACGVPVVVSSAGVLGELAEGAGTTLASTSPAEWTEALRAAVSAPGWPLFWAALERARAHDWGVVVRELSLRYRQAFGSVRMADVAPVRGRLDRTQAA